MTRIRTLVLAALAGGLALPALADTDQLARSLGVAPGLYSTAELSLLRQAREENDAFLERRILAGAGDAQVGFLSDHSLGAEAPAAAAGATGATGAGHDQLAASLGVDGGAYSTAELAAMFLDKHN